MEVFSFRDEQTTEPFLRAAIHTQPQLKLLIRVYRKIIELPTAMVTNRWYKLNIIQHRLRSTSDYPGYKVLVAINDYLEVDERLPQENVSELRNTEVYSCHHLQKSCLRGRVRKFSFGQTTSAGNKLYWISKVEGLKAGASKHKIDQCIAINFLHSEHLPLSPVTSGQLKI